MSDRSLDRRGFLKTTSLAAGATILGARATPSASAGASATLHVASNVYPWLTFYRREDRNFNADLDAGLEAVASSGVDGFEPILNTAEDIDRLEPLLEKHGLQMRSFYVNSVLHDADQARQSIDHVVELARKAKPLGSRIVVTNPSPIRWGGPENKDDHQLRLQAKSLDQLGAELRAISVTLAYHNHDIELRNAAREFHHMMVGTDPANVSLCLDAHWIYRGSGDSAVAVMDVLKLHGERISELHLRQSVHGVWTEALGEGDLDYGAMAEYLPAIGLKPHLVIEQAVEEATPKTMDAVEAHRRGRAYVDKVFAGFA